MEAAAKVQKGEPCPALAETWGGDSGDTLQGIILMRQENWFRIASFHQENNLTLEGDTDYTDLS